MEVDRLAVDRCFAVGGERSLDGEDVVVSHGLGLPVYGDGGAFGERAGEVAVRLAALAVHVDPLASVVSKRDGRWLVLVVLAADDATCVVCVCACVFFFFVCVCGGRYENKKGSNWRGTTHTSTVKIHLQPRCNL